MEILGEILKEDSRKYYGNTNGNAREILRKYWRNTEGNTEEILKEMLRKY